MKRFLLFGCDQYYPGGGWNDLIGDFDSEDEAMSAKKQSRCDSYQLVDLETKSCNYDF